MNTFSEEKIKNDCPHCDPQSFALKHPLLITNNFWVVCDVHPLTAGHILIIPKNHLSSIGEFPGKVFKEFQQLYCIFCEFIKKEYGCVASFEHGKIGQTVFHSHVHILPFSGKEKEIVSEGNQYLIKLDDLNELIHIFQKDGKYLFFSINDKNWTVNSVLGKPRFFRDRFAMALGNNERGNWKEMHTNEPLMIKAQKEIEDLEKKWKKYRKSIKLNL